MKDAISGTWPVELTYNWDPEEYDEGRNFGHLAYGVDDIYAVCQRLLDAGVTINRPPAWHLYVRPTTSQSSYCRTGMRCRPQSRGRRWKIQGTGNWGQSRALTPLLRRH
jgi:lactoylglutathione lyase